MKTNRLVGWKEQETLEILDKDLRGTAYKACLKVRLADAIGPERGEVLPVEDREFLARAHFDFVVCDRRGNMEPVFAVEFDGPHHQDPLQARRDRRKNRLCMLAKFPLLRIGYSELKEHDRLTLLEFMLERFVAYQEEHGRILSEIGEYISSLDPEEFRRLTRDGVLDASVDPSFIFDIRYPFPGIEKVSRRLLGEFGILADNLPGSLALKLHLGERPLRCSTFPKGMDFGSGSEAVQKCEYVLYQLDPAVRTIRWSEATHGLTPGVVVHCVGSVSFGMRWTLPVVEDYDPRQPAIEYILQKNEMPYAYMGIDGVFIPYIAMWFSEYLALREVEKWARAHLPHQQPRVFEPPSATT